MFSCCNALLYHYDDRAELALHGLPRLANRNANASCIVARTHTL